MTRWEEPWRAPTRGPGPRDAGDGAALAVVTVTGDDADLAAGAHAHPGSVIRLEPRGSDLARAVGLVADAPGATLVPCDLIGLAGGTVAANVVVLGVPPDRLRPWHRRHALEVVVDGRPLAVGHATTVVIANGQFLRGMDLVPRGHPGDGHLEVQVYALAPSERGPMRARLPQGVHLPHPRIVQRSGQTLSVRLLGGPGAGRGAPLEVDGRPRGRARELHATVIPGAYRLLV